MGSLSISVCVVWIDNDITTEQPELVSHLRSKWVTCSGRKHARQHTANPQTLRSNSGVFIAKHWWWNARLQDSVSDVLTNKPEKLHDLLHVLVTQTFVFKLHFQQPLMIWSFNCSPEHAAGLCGRSEDGLWIKCCLSSDRINSSFTP
ncbi:hypothetical protein CRM22_005993 [Opisthorchis felineus]|uniref:Uncharacterized protein n=1 Tax=Opisthorchis felineus TaxID=147828 RepID=A0A4S2LPS0_OPIFE|nr:hypothetical protein CRM22_005993 [Opisthorchis felineus]